MNQTTNHADIAQGWVAQNGGRGTLDILLTSIFTIFLCCWTSVCPNVPAPKSTYWQRFRSKLILAFLAIIGPDYLLILAIGQWESAGQSVKVHNTILADSRSSEGSLLLGFS